MLAVQAGNAAVATQTVGMMIYCFGRGVGTNATQSSDFVGAFSLVLAVPSAESIIDTQDS